jgi:hypothetical protein
MIMTSMAMIDIVARRRSVSERLLGFFARHASDGDIVISDAFADAMSIDVPRDLPAPAESNLWRWRRHPQLRAASVSSAMGENERRARHSAVHGLYAALAGDIEDASAWFLQAVSIHDIDLTDIPSFWQMPRGAIEAAAVAYECVGRFREAAMVQARLRTEFRPRNVINLRTAPSDDVLPLEVAAR